MDKIPETPTAFDSPEEEWCSWYLQELVDAGYAAAFRRARTFLLSEPLRRLVHGGTKKRKPTESDLLKDHVYTPDFEVVWNLSALGLLFQGWQAPETDARVPFYASDLGDGLPVSILEVKPFFDRHGKTAWAACQIKWTLQRHGCLVQIVKIGSNARAKSPKAGGLFASTFTPARYLKTRTTGKDRRIHHEARTLAEYVAERKA